LAQQFGEIVVMFKRVEAEYTGKLFVFEVFQRVPFGTRDESFERGR